MARYTYMNRYLESAVSDDLWRKMVFIGGPRQSGKTTLAKHYHLDWAAVTAWGLRFENLVACHLLKWCYYRQDTRGNDTELRYFRDIDKREVDFVVLEELRCDRTWTKILHGLRELQISYFSTPRHRFYRRNELTHRVRRILKSLKINRPNLIQGLEEQP